MDLRTVFLLIFAALATSYGWGMRGTIIGGEKGAMLPGALLGMVLSLLSDSYLLASAPYLLAGVGAISMYCGGNMTYAQTLDLTMSEPAPSTYKKGMCALLLKGGIWFGLYGGFISLFISAISGYLSLIHILVFFAALPVFALVFFKIFNTPFDSEKNIFPKIYFSNGSRETWGGLLGILIEILIFSAITRDLSTLVMTAGSTVSGAIGWVIAQYFQVRIKHPNKNGKILFKESGKNGLIDSWKVMECVFGAIGGLGVSITLLISKPLFADKFETLDTYGAVSCIPESAAKILFYVYGALILADIIHFFFIPYSGSNKIRKTYLKLCEKSEFALYSMIPMLFCFLGCNDFAIMSSLCVIVLVLCQEIAEKLHVRYDKTFLRKIIVFLPAIALFVIQVITDKPFSASVMMIIYTFLYEIVFFIMRKLDLFGFKTTKIYDVEKTVHGYFSIVCILLNIFIII